MILCSGSSGIILVAKRCSVFVSDDTEFSGQTLIEVIMDIEKTFREVIMGDKPEVVGRTTFPPKMCDHELQKKLDDSLDLLLHIRNNWDKEYFDGEDVDRKIDALLGRIS